MDTLNKAIRVCEQLGIHNNVIYITKRQTNTNINYQLKIGGKKPESCVFQLCLGVDTRGVVFGYSVVIVVVRLCGVCVVF